MEISLNTFFVSYITMTLGIVLLSWVLFIRRTSRKKVSGEFLHCDCCGEKIYYSAYTGHVRCKKCGKRNTIASDQSLGA